MTEPGILGTLGVRSSIIVCANNDCRLPTVDFMLRKYQSVASGGFVPALNAPPVVHRRIMPDSMAKPQPDYIPEAIREDYREACLIRDLSAKASATLSRRCLQGMIRDFCGISKKRLIDEIKELEKQVNEGTADRSISIESVNAIDAVRKVGNIGAHMEADVDHIVPVDPGEAQLLIDLIEDLFTDWYIQRHNRQARFGALAALAANKEQQKVAKPQAVLAAPRPVEEEPL